MAFHVTHLHGSVESIPEEELGELLDELGAADDEHPDVSVTHESGWSMAFFASGLVVLENVEPGAPQPVHMDGVRRDEALELMRELARGDVASVLTRPWLAGYY